MVWWVNDTADLPKLWVRFVWAINHLVGYVSKFVGQSGMTSYADGVGTNAKFNSPTSIALDGSGNAYILDSYAAYIRKIVLSSGAFNLPHIALSPW
jgi:hypothetical protein